MSLARIHQFAGSHFSFAQAIAIGSLIALPISAAQAGNATIIEAKPVLLHVKEPGEILNADDTHFYRFDNALKVRDLATIRLENLSTTLKPDIKIYDANKSQLSEKYDGTIGASVETVLALEPGKAIYVQVLPYGSVGKYNVSVTPQNAHDKYEANDDLLSATPETIGQTVTANIMDDKDVDTYRIHGIAAKSVMVTLDNQSTTLKPDIKVFNANKSQVSEKYDGTAGANLSFEVTTAPGEDIYVQIEPYGSSGKYQLLLK